MRFNWNKNFEKLKVDMITFCLIVMTFLSCQDTTSNEKAASNTLEESPDVIDQKTMIDGANVLAFGPDNVLFAGDSKNGKMS